MNFMAKSSWYYSQLRYFRDTDVVSIFEIWRCKIRHLKYWSWRLFVIQNSSFYTFVLQSPYTLGYHSLLFALFHLPATFPLIDLYFFFFLLEVPITCVQLFLMNLVLILVVIHSFCVLTVIVCGLAITLNWIFTAHD